MATLTSEQGTTTTQNVRYIPTTDAYDRWAAVYDTDGNFLQAIDDEEMRGWLLQKFLRELARQEAEEESKRDKKQGKKVIDLGCGTGRNTALLLDVGTAVEPGVDDRVAITDIVALDASPGMLGVARTRLLAPGTGIKQYEPADLSATTIARAGTADKTITFALYDILAEGAPPAVSTTADDELPPAPSPALDQNSTSAAVTGPADGIISTLVVEHIPLPTYFSCASKLLKPGGVLLLTNMHADMGRLSQAGFVDKDSGEKVRPEGSWAHTVPEVVAEARRWGFEVVVEDVDKGEEGCGLGREEDGGQRGDGAGSMSAGAGGVEGITERAVHESMVERLGVRSRKWVGVTCWFGGLFRKTCAAP